MTFEYPPVTHPTTGGIGSWASALAPAMASRGNDVHVLTWAEGAGQSVENAGVTVHLRRRLTQTVSLSAAGKVAHVIGPGMLVRRHLARLGPFDLVIAPEWGGEAWLYATDRRNGPLLTQLAGSRAVLAPHLGPPGNWRESLLGRFQDVRERFQTTHSDAVAGCSTALLARTHQAWNLDHRPTYVLPNPVDVGRVRTLAENTAPVLSPGARAVAFVGRLEPRKGVHVLVDAMRMVWGIHEDAELLLIGADAPWPGGVPASQHLRRRAGEFAERIRIIGEQTQATLFSTLTRVCMVATPSLWEPFGLATLEAMALGIPVIATSGNGFAEFVRDGQDGFLVPPDDPRALTIAIRRLLDDEQLRRRNGQSAAQQADRFDVSVVAGLHERHYSRIATCSSDRGSHWLRARRAHLSAATRRSTWP